MSTPETEPVPILIVDDRPENLLTLEAVLSSPGYRVVQASSGFEALSQLLKQDFAVILLDVQMPGMDGFETAELIRKREKSRAIPIIFVTAVYQDLTHISKGYESGAVDYMLKPFEPSILKSKVSVFVDLYRQREEIKRQSDLLLCEQAERSKSEVLQRYYHDVIDRLDHSIIWEADAPELKFQFVSRRAVKLLGHPHEQWFSEKDFFLNHMHPDDREIFREMLNLAWTRKSDERCEHRMIGADGKTYWFHTGVQIESANEVRKGPTFRGLSVEITPLKMAEEDLKLREAKFRRVVDSNMIGHIFTNLNWKISEANDCFLRMLGYTREDLALNLIDAERLTPPEFALADQKAINEIKESTVCTPYEKEFFAKDGSRVPVMLGAALLEGSKSDCVCFVMDLTERKQVEYEKERAVQAREELLEIVSHDLKNPLGAILMNATLLFRRLPATADTPPIRKQLEVIQRSADRMKRLIEDLLDLAKVESGRLTIEKKDEPIKALLENAAEMFEPVAAQKGLRFEIKAADPDAILTCDRERIIQVLSNLIGNAVKFTPQNGCITLGGKVERDEVIIEVIDTGPGISEEDLKKIFVRYWQSKKTARQGTGLGLSISKGIVEAHGGKIWAESKPGTGSRFVFAIPKGQSRAA